LETGNKDNQGKEVNDFKRGYKENVFTSLNSFTFFTLEFFCFVFHILPVIIFAEIELEHDRKVNRNK